MTDSLDSQPGGTDRQLTDRWTVETGRDKFQALVKITTKVSESDTRSVTMRQTEIETRVKGRSSHPDFRTAAHRRGGGGQGRPGCPSDGL